MTWDEFRQQWYPEHCACFTGIPAWMAKLEKSPDGPATRDILKSWYGVLRDVELREAVRASHRMHSGEIDEPCGFDRHPAAIRNAAGIQREISRPKPIYDADGNQTYACPICFDGGMVHVWHPATVAEIARRGITDSIRNRSLYDCALPCTCKMGDNYARSFPRSPRYDPKRACIIGIGGVSDRDEQTRLLEWIETHKPFQPANYENAFAEFA